MEVQGIPPTCDGTVCRHLVLSSLLDYYLVLVICGVVL